MRNLLLRVHINTDCPSVRTDRICLIVPIPQDVQIGQIREDRIVGLECMLNDIWCNGCEDWIRLELDGDPVLTDRPVGSVWERDSDAESEIGTDAGSDLDSDPDPDLSDMVHAIFDPIVTFRRDLHWNCPTCVSVREGGGVSVGVDVIPITTVGAVNRVIG